jgi:GTP:adenosylcobinamide-phosphate guanylyltransferase
MRKMKVKPALDAAGQPLVQRVFNQVSCFLTVHIYPSFPLDESSG